VIAGATADLAAQRLHLGAQAGGLQRVLHRHRQFVEVQRLAHEVVGAQLERGLHVLQLRIGGDHDDGAGVVRFLQLLQDFDAAGIGQAHVEQHEVGRLVVGHAQRCRAVVSLQYVITPLFALLPQRPTNQLLVVDN
jgi:hypothetical protein